MIDVSRRSLSLIASLVVAALVPVAGQPARAAEGPVLESDPEAMAEALECPDSFTDDEREPLLLVHGTFATPEENWGWNYAAALPEQGWDVCTVRLPERSNVDIQLSSEYVVYAIRQITGRSGEPVDVMGHSQGGLQPRWAVKWWPDVEAAVDDLVMLATPNHGTVPADVAYEFGCFPACYQMASQSNFIAALNRDDETPGDISYTSIYSLTDQLVQPAAPEPTAAIEGAENILVQDLCPGRPVEHVQFAYDAVVHAMVVDALTGDGPADPTGFDPLTCAEVWFDGVDPSVFPTLISDNALTDAFGGGEYGGRGEEPPLKDYARSSGGSDDPDDPGNDEGSGGGAAVDGSGTKVAGTESTRSSSPLPATGGAAPLLGALGLLTPAAALTWRRRGSA